MDSSRIFADILNDDEYNAIVHYGTPRHSGRYPWGSGEHPYQSENFYAGVEKLRKCGMSDTEIARSFNMSTGEFRARKSIAKDEVRRHQIEMAEKLKAKGYSNVEIGRRLGVGESQVRNLLNPETRAKREASLILADRLEEELKRNPYLDVGEGVARHLNVSDQKLDAALYILKERGYNVYGNIKVKQGGTGKMTTLKVLTPHSWVEAQRAKSDISMPEWRAEKDEEGNEVFFPIEKPRSVDSNRIQINYADANGYQPKDGVIELRPGVEDLNLGSAHYAQVRILVDGTHYIKGMAVYSDNLPPGIDIRVNTNKKPGTPIGDVLKKAKITEDNPENPFGASIKSDRELNFVQRHYVDKNGNVQLSSLNVVNEEGNWDDWSRTLSSQFLGKQSPSLAQRQLGLAFDIRDSEFRELRTLTNPEVKKKLLTEFADQCDSDSVYLKAANMPNQSCKVILPITSIPKGQIFCPDFEDGTRVVLVRHPHAGPFESPELVVNNRIAEARKILGSNPRDAVGIHPSVASVLSGADFDGDSVIVIPNDKRQVAFANPDDRGPLAKLREFEPKRDYGYSEKVEQPDGSYRYFRNGVEFQIMRNTQNEMGRVSNLITDMTIQKASADEIARAVRYSMVVIDAEKHKLDYKQAYLDNGIKELKAKYQGHINPENGRYSEGSSTLLSRAKSPKVIPERTQGAWVRDPETGRSKKLYIDPETGEKIFTNTNGTHNSPIRNKQGDIIGWKKEPNMIQVPKMELTSDARSLMSKDGGTAMERIYAEHANKLKRLANQARLEAQDIPSSKRESSAAKIFANEVAQLDAAIEEYEKRKPIERKAQLIAGKIFAARRADNPQWEKDDMVKAHQRALRDARNRLGIEHFVFNITDAQWKAIQAHAISATKLRKILSFANEARVKELALPKQSKEMSPTKLSLAKAMIFNRGYTWTEAARYLGVSVSTLKRELGPKKES